MASGNAVYKFDAQRAFDVIVVDNVMPDLTGTPKKLLLPLLLSATLLPAQNAGIQGVVTDASKSVVVNSTITATNLDTGASVIFGTPGRDRIPWPRNRVASEFRLLDSEFWYEGSSSLHITSISNHSIKPSRSITAI